MRKYPRIRGRVISVKELDSGNRYRRARRSVLSRGTPCGSRATCRCELSTITLIEFQGEQTIDIRDFGLEPPKLLMLKVYPEVNIRGRVLAQLEMHACRRQDYVPWNPGRNIRDA